MLAACWLCRSPLLKLAKYSYAVPVWGRFLLARGSHVESYVDHWSFYPVRLGWLTEVSWLPTLYEASMMKGDSIMKAWIGVDIAMEGIMAVVGQWMAHLSWNVTL